MNVAGVLIGFILPSVFVDSYDGEELTDQSVKDKYEQQMFNMLLASSCFGTVITILVFLTFRETVGAPLFGKRTGRASAFDNDEAPKEEEFSLVQ